MTTNASPILPLGEIVAWKCATTSHERLTAALSAAGLDPKAARELAPRNAFSRACRKLSDQRVIRQVSEDAKTITFQFTRESKVGREFHYSLETHLVLTKDDGDIACDVEALAAAARIELDKAFEVRTVSDVTSIVQRLFERHGDLFPVRPQGGCYFVPHTHAGLVDQVQTFLGEIGGAIVRYAVSAGNPETERSVRQTVADGLATVLAEHRAAVEEFGSDTRDSTIKRAAEKIRNARFKVEAYAALLGEQRENLERDLAAATAALKAKVVEIGRAMPREPAGGSSRPAETPRGVAARAAGGELFPTVEV